MALSSTDTDCGVLGLRLVSEHPPCVLVIGIQRSGTSLVAGICDRLGYDMGVNPVAYSARYYEDNDLLAVCRAISRDWMLPQKHFLLAGNAEDKGPRELMEEWIAKRVAPGKPWGAKSPYFALNGQFFVQMIPNVRVIFTERDLEASIDSLHRREQSLPRRCCEDIQSEAFRARIVLEKELGAQRVPAIIVNFDQLVDNPARIVPRIAEFLKTDADISEAIRLVDPGLRHS